MFIDGVSLGGADDTMAAHASGSLLAQLTEAGALPPPPAEPAAAAPSGLEALLRSLPARADRPVSAAARPQSALREPRPAPSLHRGAGELAPQSTAAPPPPKPLTAKPVSASTEMALEEYLAELPAHLT